MRKNTSIISSVLNAINGIKFAIISERNLKFHLFFSLIVLFFSYFFKISKIELIIVLICIFLVITFEILNTIIEKSMDIISEEYDERIKFVKDMSAGVVLLISILSCIVGMIIFLPKIF